MLSIALVLNAEDAAPYTIDKTEFITESGAFRFHKITNSDKSLEFEINSLGSTQFLIIYTSSICANSAVAATSLNAAACQDQAAEEFIISELDGESRIVLNDDGIYSFVGGNTMLLSKAIDTLKQSPSSTLRITQFKNVPLIIELNLLGTNLEENLDLIRSLNACLQAVIQRSIYIPYRDSPLSKLLWPALAGKVESFTSICVLDTNRAANLLPILNLSTNIYRWAQLDCLHLKEVYAHMRKVSRGVSKHKPRGDYPETSLKKLVRDAAHELARLYEQELTRLKIEHIRKKREQEARVACEIHALSRIKNETLSGLNSEIHCLETQLFIARHHEDSRTHSEVRIEPETWFSQELRRKSKLKEGLIHQRSRLLEALAEADKFEVPEPIRGLIRQFEFNLRSLKRRAEAAELNLE